jgi:thiamine kinase-like enzyme
LIKIGNRDDAYTVAHEADIYKYLFGNTKATRFQKYLPRFYEYDTSQGILILEYLDKTEDLRSFHSRIKRFPAYIGAEIGKILGELHKVEILNAERLQTFPKTGLNSLFCLYEPPLELFTDISNANIQIIKIIQSFDVFEKLLDQLQDEWRATSLIHYDVKWDNFLVDHSALKRADRLKIVDLELAGHGDPCWDIGSVFNDYLSFWLLSIPITGDFIAEKFNALARYPLKNMQPAIRAFWKSYVKTMNLSKSQEREWLLRSVKLAAVRLLQTTYEHMQVAFNVNGSAICQLQVSLNILQRPKEALVHLLGISLE